MSCLQAGVISVAASSAQSAFISRVGCRRLSSNKSWLSLSTVSSLSIAELPV
jgi:hypothetical protein